MPKKVIYYIAVFIGSTIGSYLPTIWGAGFLSISSLLLSTFGGILGIIIVYKYF